MLELIHTFLLQPASNLAVFAAVFIAIELCWPAIPNQPIWRRDTKLDLVLSFVNPFLIHPFVGILVALIVNAILQATGYQYLASAQAWVAAHPFWLQLGAGLFISDLASYWKHRLFHTKILWPFHAVHHSATEVDWLTNDRDHPFQVLGTNVLVIPVLVLTGFSNEMIALLATLRRAYSLYTRANIGWSYGVLNSIFVSPMFHRWHHSADSDMAGKNFAVFFSFFDVLFGSYRIPAGQPLAFGLSDGNPPENLLAVLGHPLPYFSAFRFSRGRSIAS